MKINTDGDLVSKKLILKHYYFLKYNLSVDVQFNFSLYVQESDQNTGYFTSDNVLNGIENATHNTFPMTS
jgi:hypothetical protein